MKVKVFKANPKAHLPNNKHSEVEHRRNAGFDVAVPGTKKAGDKSVEVIAGTPVCIDLGIVVEMPEDFVDGHRYTPPRPMTFVMKVYPRSSLGSKYGMRIMNTVGIIDSNYCGPLDTIKVWITAETGFTLEPGERFAQIVFEQALIPDIVELKKSSELSVQKSRKGFGSTGKV